MTKEDAVAMAAVMVDALRSHCEHALGSTEGNVQIEDTIIRDAAGEHQPLVVITVTTFVSVLWKPLHRIHVAVAIARARYGQQTVSLEFLT